MNAATHVTIGNLRPVPRIGLGGNKLCGPDIWGPPRDVEAAVTAVHVACDSGVPDPFQAFAESVVVGQKLNGRVTKLLPFGVVVEVANGIEGVVHMGELAGTPSDAPRDDVQLGDNITVVVIGLDRQRRTVSLSERQARPGQQ